MTANSDPHDKPSAPASHPGAEPSAHVQKVDLTYTWDDPSLPAEATAQLREVCHRLASNSKAGARPETSALHGVSGLFTGPSGTGKTIAAAVLARELGLDLYRVDIRAVVSKYIGETEKNLSRIFSAAESAGSILFFDEADALFGKRSEVKDSHDRYANLEVNFLLRKMEAFDGVTILAANIKQDRDDAITRRFTFTVHFPAARRRVKS